MLAVEFRGRYRSAELARQETLPRFLHFGRIGVQPVYDVRIALLQPCRQFPVTAAEMNHQTALGPARLQSIVRLPAHGRKPENEN